jgi:hypothetical protein
MVAALLPTLNACQTAPINLQTVQQGSWDSKVLIKDLKRQKTFIVYMHANAIFNENLRVDLVSTLGTQVASIVLNGKNLTYLVVPQKRYFTGESDPESLRAVTSIPLDARWFYNVLFDRPLTGEEWECTKNKEGLVEVCQNSQLRLQITWKDRSGPRKIVLIEHERGSLQINFQSFSPQIDQRDNLFSLAIPPDYARLKTPTRNTP